MSAERQRIVLMQRASVSDATKFEVLSSQRSEAPRASINSKDSRKDLIHGGLDCFDGVVYGLHYYFSKRVDAADDGMQSLRLGRGPNSRFEVGNGMTSFSL